ncbi:hypothetical protein BJV82DRAFT_676160 [Fennellomyces sp. T-0311]|nr:hypothetical protein BJV82DRAFT_676160 [Fennellomyces sp. T-0311]
MPRDQDTSQRTDESIPLTETTGQRILQALESVTQLLHNNNAQPSFSTARQGASEGATNHCKNPTTTVDGKEKNIKDITIPHVKAALTSYFGVIDENLESVQKDFTVHLMRPLRDHMQYKLRESGLPETTAWNDIPPGIQEAAIERLEQKALKVLNVRLADCTGN